MVLRTAIEELQTGLAARREEILCRTASARRKETSADRVAISGVMTALAIAAASVIEVALVIVAIVVVLAIAEASVIEVALVIAATAAALAIAAVSVTEAE